MRENVYYPFNTRARVPHHRKTVPVHEGCFRCVTFRKQEWPDRCQLMIKGALSPYWQVRGEITLHDNSPSMRTCSYMAVVFLSPKGLQATTLQKVHNGHQGIQRCQVCVSSSVWWPRVLKEIEQLVKSCPICATATPTYKEPLMYSPLPNHPREKVGSDLFELSGSTYLLVVDYCSHYIEIQKLSSTNSKTVIVALKAISRHGIPAIFVSYNGPQYTSQEMKEFAQSYGFKHVSSSPHLPHFNGMAERSVKTVKSLLVKSSSPYIAVLNYRATPLPWCNLSPAEP